MTKATLEGRPPGSPSPAAFDEPVPPARDGEMARLIRAFDWASTPLGPIEGWPQSLKTVVGILLTSRFAMWMGWGPELTFLYNDAYRQMTLGRKHPWALGRPSRTVWEEIWPDIGPRIQSVLETGVATWDEKLFLVLERSGYPEETYHTFSYSPLTDDGGVIAGHLCVVSEETDPVIADRRLGSFRNLAAALAATRREADTLAAVQQVLADNPRDLPFTLLYLLDEHAAEARLVSRTGIEIAHAAAPPIARVGESDDPSAWPLRAVETHQSMITVDHLRDRFADLPNGPWPIPPDQALVMPIAQQGQDRPAGFFIVGLNPYRPFDGTYRDFVELLGGQIASGLANARAYEHERRRAESLAELDRAKTDFFSNVSHEFRTPLTLLLGPLEDALAGADLTPTLWDVISLAHRNALRLLRLVNALLEFTRIEAGRVEALYEPVDLSAYTADLASGFRSATERLGLELAIDAPALPDLVYVDRDMWEKVVLNLISNAIKYTFDGGITVRVGTRDGFAVVDVQDTGVGIAAKDLPHIFERFHRVPSTRSRTHEGSGIGLALVHELVRLHGGHVEVSSVEGRGSTFSVYLPLGAHHLPADRLATRSRRERRRTIGGGAPYAEEVWRWSSPADGDQTAVPSRGGTSPAQGASAGGDAAAPRILLADDNADTREYVARLLRAEGWRVNVVSDGRAALEAARADKPDLVLSDVMMPGLDGFALVRELRQTPETANVPIILLSARAGEEARVEGARATADDYVVKPFAARELVARVGAHLTLARERARAAAVEAAARAEANRERLTADKASRAKSEFLAVMSHELRTPLNAIAGHVQLLELEIYGPLTDTQRDALQRVTRTQRHLLGLVNDVLNLSRIEAGRVDYAVSRLVLQQVITSLGSMIEPQIAAKGLTYQIRVPGVPVVAEGDPEKLDQILLNLLSNAVKFTPSGGRITLEVPEPAPDGRFVLIRVIDTGIGIPREQQEVIFEPFVQLEVGPTRSGSGTGLGLTIARDLARGMGGELSVESVAGRGATFTLTLPAPQS